MDKTRKLFPLFQLTIALGVAACANDLRADGADLQRIASFRNDGGAGVTPQGYGIAGALVKAADGNYYGAQSTGGDNGTGTVIRITPSGSVEVLHSFASVDESVWPPTNSDGWQPSSGLTLGNDGKLYGVTADGGSYGNGTIFRVSTDGNFEVVHTFDAFSSANPPFTNNDGTTAFGSLAQGPDGALYGGASGGGSYGFGTLFKIDSSGNFVKLYDDPDGNDAASAESTGVRVFGTDGNLYGVSFSFSDFTSNGYIYKLTPGGNYSKLYSFSGSDGADPDALVAGADGNLYGATWLGGISDTGTLFKLSLQGQLTTLHSFDTAPSVLIFSPGSKPPYTRGPAGFDQDGGWPNSLVAGPDGNLYGTNYTLGPVEEGVLYKLTPDGDYDNLFAFGNQGLGPSSLASDGDGGFTLVTQRSDTNGNGSVYRIAVDGALKVTASFTPSTIQLGEATTFEWWSHGAQSCTVVTPKTATVSPGPIPREGRLTIQPLSRRTLKPTEFIVGVQCVAADGRMANTTATLTIP
jgi:uncharacterized repeat protein (TIGR03803 family)